MKLSTSLARGLPLLPATALALSVAARQDDVVALTDEYLFSITLDQFIAYRDAQDPNTVDWASDGCTDSPDNPLGFNFEPACYRHDFGYTNYREQSRFTESAKASIDSNFLSDLKYQCEDEFLEFICDALAEVYYAAVKAFGGGDATPGKRSGPSSPSGELPARPRAGADPALVADYEAKLALYESLLAEGRASGEVPGEKARREASAAGWAALYREKVAAYNQLVSEAGLDGQISMQISNETLPRVGSRV